VAEGELALWELTRKVPFEGGKRIRGTLINSHLRRLEHVELLSLQEWLRKNRRAADGCTSAEPDGVTASDDPPRRHSQGGQPRRDHQILEC